METNESQTRPQSNGPKRSNSQKRWRRAVVGVAMVGSLSLVAVLSVPPLLMQTKLRNDLLSNSFSSMGLTATCEDASGGWIEPLEFQDVRLSDSHGQITSQIESLHISNGLFWLLLNPNDLGKITLRQPATEVRLNEDGSWPIPENSSTSQSLCEFTIDRGAFRLIAPWRRLPIIDLDALTVNGRVSNDRDSRRIMTIDAFQLFDHEPVSDKHAEQNLALIAPVLSQSTELGGSASVWIDEVNLVLGDGDIPSPPFAMSGRAQFHSLEARLKPNWVRQLAILTGQLTGKQLPDRLQIVQESNVTFSVSPDGIHHDAMSFLLPELATGLTAETSGKIALDESLDLRLAIHLPSPNLRPRDSLPTPAALAMLTQLAKQPILVSVKGTVANPQIQLPDGMTFFDEIARNLAPEQQETEPKPVSQAVFELIQGVSQPDRKESEKNLPGGIFNLIRSIKAEKERKDQQNID
ncbi:MAG: hypothetical protein KDA91_10225 [Planctomycetaceae bacterium]|nr:hypothetical protein [Planctomycetaceae bacterium]